MKVGVIGAGWFGCHVGRGLSKSGYEVTIYEKNSDIFTNISGDFGIRLHAGPHYPRSEETRKSCQRGLAKFRKAYPELVVENDHSIYGLGSTDADGKPSKVTWEELKAVGKECEDYCEINPEQKEYANLIGAMSVYEPSMVLGERLRKTFRRYLQEDGVKIICNMEIKKIEKCDDKMAIIHGEGIELFDFVINATSYQALLPTTNFPFEIEIVYQPCIVLMYEDTKPNHRPFSFTVMDGWYPCVMPFVDQEQDEKSPRKYVLYHAKWTIMDSLKTPSEAHNLLATKLNDDFVKDNLISKFEDDAEKFFPEFKNRFKYCGWKGNVLAKLKTNREFRSSITFEHEGVIYVFPGKINNIFDVEEETLALIRNQNIVNKENYRYVQGGILDSGLHEITEKPDPRIANTCDLQTYRELVIHCRAVPKYQAAKSLPFWSTSEEEIKELAMPTQTSSPLP